jgi:2-phosphoglycolate phosphatase
MASINPVPRAVIFDMDGTLADTFPLVVASWNEALRAHAGRDFTAEEVIARFGVPDPEMIRGALPQALWDEAIERYHAHYESAHAMAKPFEGVTELLESLRRAGRPLGLVTGKGRRAAEISLRALGWGELFGAIITGEDVKAQKPAPDGLSEAARRLGVQPGECVFVGDSPADIGAGHAAGMTTIAAGWHPVYLDQLRELRPHHWAQRPADVARIVGLEPMPA